MKTLGMATAGFEQASHTFFGDFGEASSGSDATAFIEMIDDVDRFGFT